MFALPDKTPYDLNLRMLGIPVRIHPLFWLVAVILGASDDIVFSELFGWVIALLVSVLIHEYGHALAARRFGARDVRIILHGMGGVTVSNARLSHRERIIELLWGPGAGFILFGLVTMLTCVVDIRSLPVVLYVALFYLKYINLIWGLLNLAPIYPLDGGQIINEIAKLKAPWRANELTFKVSMAVSVITAIFFAVLALSSSSGNIFGSWFPVLLFAALAVMNYQMFKSRFMVSDRDEHTEGRRYSWERDPDWWKR